MIGELISDKFGRYVSEAAKLLRKHEYEEAYKFIMKAAGENPNAPEPHNLLGIWYESQGYNDLARKHYRVAYVLDPTYKPASVNLERVSTLFLNRVIDMDYGEAENEIIRIVSGENYD